MGIDGHGDRKTKALPSDVFNCFPLRIKSFGENRQEQMRGARRLTKMEEV